MQAIEVFDPEWILWDGLRDALPPPHPQSGAGAAALDAARAALKELRQRLEKLPAAQVAAVRAECNAMLEELDAHGVPRS